MSLAETAEFLQSAGFNVLLYDSRSIGGSGGVPRNQIDPIQMSQDISDVVSYAVTLPTVQQRQILLWGMSLGATVSGVAAAIDSRVAAVLMVCPIFRFVRADKRASAFPLLMKDRQSQLRGNEPLTLQPFNSKGENPIGYAGSGGPGGKEAYFLMREAAVRGHPNFRDRITLQSYHKMALFRPIELLEEMLEGVPTMFMVPEQDNISPAVEQRAVYDKLSTPKRIYMANGKGHMSILTGEGSVQIREAMVEFFRLALDNMIR
ncbi:putative Serine aminopeptidase S33 domain-containing protein [Seiridium unicorne]|uniref:Serine aminopeptidase S33 domain-containing protein n=1 Tax=Seiridium unicorne TaxID=138068 RepID=A0ABR2V0I0_9PEZI